VGVYSDGYDYLAPNFPYIDGHSIDLDTTLVKVNNQDVSFKQSDLPYFENTNKGSDMFFTFDVKPAEGFVWPSDTFRLYAGGKGYVPEFQGGIGAVASIRHPYTYANPKKEYLPDQWYSQTCSSYDMLDGRWGDPLVVPGKNYTSSSRPFQYGTEPGLWVNEGDLIEVISSEEEYTISNPYSSLVIDGDGADSAAGNSGLFHDLPFYAFIGGVFDQQGNIYPLESEYESDGFVGKGFRQLRAPTDGFVGFGLNYNPSGYDMWKGSPYEFSARVVPEPAGFVLFGLGTLLIRRGRIG
jgi:hypothetical protein